MTLCWLPYKYSSLKCWLGLGLALGLTCVFVLRLTLGLTPNPNPVYCDVRHRELTLGMLLCTESISMSNPMGMRSMGLYYAIQFSFIHITPFVHTAIQGA